MTTDLASRRPIRTVVHADFAVYPVWEWAVGEAAGFGYEEAFVRPTALEAIPAATDGHYVVAASMTLSEGSVLPGCVEVTLRHGKLRAEPMFIFLQERQLPVGGPETMRVLSHFTKTTAARAHGWQLAVPVAGETSPRRGTMRRGLLSALGQLLARNRVAVAP